MKGSVRSGVHLSEKQGAQRSQSQNGHCDPHSTVVGAGSTGRDTAQMHSEREQRYAQQQQTQRSA